MQIPALLRSKQAALHVVTVVVALCSFAYELAYAELLTVLYGGTVTQYGLTIGLFFFSLGVGSYLARHLDDSRESNFFRTELYIGVIAPLGVLFVVWVNAGQALAALPPLVEQVVVRIPVVLVGVLSGLELPMLLSMVEDESDTTGRLSDGVRTFVSGVDTAAYRAASLIFHTSRDGNEYNIYSSVLAMDYLGGLLGALAFVFYLYPEVGLVGSVAGLAFLNCLAALLFSLRFSAHGWNRFSADRSVVTHERVSAVVVCVLLTVVLGGALAQNEAVNNEVTSYYMENAIEQEYPRDTIEATVTDQYTTEYQQVTYYDRTWVGEGNNTAFPGKSEQCLRLGTAIQLCESWAESYHHGLVDVPLSMYENSTDTDVLVLGGGDWIAANNLREHNVSVDLVDVDSAFMQQAKTDDLLERYHEDAYEYEHLTVYQQDAFEFLETTTDTYDLILLDLPGATDDDLLHLYSTEFYSLLTERLSPDGVVGTWAYTQYAYPEHYHTYMNTLAEAGFSNVLDYWAYDDLNNDGNRQLGERFFLLTPDGAQPSIDPANGSAYVRQHDDSYNATAWTTTPTYEGYEPSSIFQPNYNLIIEQRVTDDN
ncbi:MAG: putative spermidine synthase with an N-terminal membrane domain protein [halophilic archaeon J07HX64]|jgi:Predicted spermidine synthase with an N-terminal membrane domain|nr:MAG: putative spermidine synthase with an N-terminal membrane domain protein [halophilic archaeon J07HX64]